MDPIPAPIQRTIVRALVCTASVTLFGVIWGIAAHDGTLPALSALIAVFGSQKAVSMIRDARKGRFQTLECTVLSDRSDRLQYDLPAEVQIGYRLKYSISVFRPGLLVRDARLNRVVVRVDGGYYFIRGTDVVHTAFKASYELRGAQRRLLRQTDHGRIHSSEKSGKPA